MTKPVPIPSILQRVMSPGDVVDILLNRGVKISERELRHRARKIGAYRQIGRAIFFLPEDLERLMEPQTCSNSESAPKVRTGSRGGRSTVSELSEARARLQSLRRGKGSRKS